MRTLLLAAMFLIGYSSSAQYNEDQIQRLWNSADTTTLKVSYEASKVVLPHVEQTAFEQELILQQRQFDHE